MIIIIIIIIIIITNIMMRRWNHNVILFRGISRFLSAVCRRWFPGQSGDRTCLVLYKRLVICFARPFQLLPSACTSDIPMTLSWKFVNYHYHKKISQNLLRQFFKKLYNVDHCIRRRLSDHNKITFATKYLLMSHI